MSSTGTTPKGAIPSAETLQCSKPRIQFKMKMLPSKTLKSSLTSKECEEEYESPHDDVGPTREDGRVVTLSADAKAFFSHDATSTASS